MPRTDTSTLTALIVDDDDGVRRLIEQQLTHMGMATASAGNGADALTLLRAMHADVIVLDLAMPVMDGRAFLRELRALGAMTPVLVLSVDRVAANELDIDDAMLKPFDPDGLARRVRELALSGRAHR